MYLERRELEPSVPGSGVLTTFALAPRVFWQDYLNPSLHHCSPIFTSHRNDGGLIGNTEDWKMRPNGIGDVARCAMGIMLFSHAGVAMTKLRCDHAHRYATHRLLESNLTADRRLGSFP